MALLIITTILWAFSFSFYGEYLAGHVDSYFAVLVRVGLAALVFLPFLRTRGNSLKTVGLYMLVGAMQLGVMYMLSFRAYLYLTVSELLLFTVLTPLYITLIYDIMSKRRLRWGYAFSALLAVRSSQKRSCMRLSTTRSSSACKRSVGVASSPAPANNGSPARILSRTQW